MRHICETCRHALKFDFPPTPGGAEDGVHCDSPAMAQELASFTDHGSVLLWRVEIVACDAECLYWASAN